MSGDDLGLADEAPVPKVETADPSHRLRSLRRQEPEADPPPRSRLEWYLTKIQLRVTTALSRVRRGEAGHLYPAKAADLLPPSRVGYSHTSAMRSGFLGQEQRAMP